MKESVKRILISGAAVALAIALIFTYYVYAVFNFNEYVTTLSVNEEKGELELLGECCKILQLSDVQTSNLVESAIAYPMVERVIKRTEPDLIILTGDNVSNGSSPRVVKRFITFMDSFEIPWALVFGNHDYNSDLSPAELCEAYEESEYCLFKRGSISDRHGNYHYNLTANGETFYSLIFMDSEKDGFIDEQVEWYKSTVEGIKTSEGKTIPSLAFFHIPIKETADAHEAWAFDSSIGTGRLVDDVRTQNLETAFFDTVCALGSTKGLFYGHDHENNTMITYRGVLFCYATKTGRTVYYANDSLGGNLITIRRDATFTVERIKG